MTIWTVPLPAVLVLMLVFLYLGLLGMKIQKVAYDVADRLVAKEGTGVSKRNVESFCSRIVPFWSRAAGWTASRAALLLLFYVGFRFGWPWAVGYAVTDHLLKSVGFPILPTVAQAHNILLAEARKKAPETVSSMEALQGETQGD